MRPRRTVRGPALEVGERVCVWEPGRGAHPRGALVEVVARDANPVVRGVPRDGDGRVGRSRHDEAGRHRRRRLVAVALAQEREVGRNRRLLFAAGGRDPEIDAVAPLRGGDRIGPVLRGEVLCVERRDRQHPGCRRRRRRGERRCLARRVNPHDDQVGCGRGGERAGILDRAGPNGADPVAMLPVVRVAGIGNCVGPFLRCAGANGVRTRSPPLPAARAACLSSRLFRCRLSSTRAFMPAPRIRRRTSA